MIILQVILRLQGVRECDIALAMFEGSALEPSCSVSDAFCNGSSPASNGNLSDSLFMLAKLDDSSRTSEVVDADKKNDRELATQLDKSLLHQGEELRCTNEHIIQEFDKKIEVNLPLPNFGCLSL